MASVSTEQYLQTLKKLKQQIRRVWQKREVELRPSPAWQRQTAHQFVYKGRNCNSGGDCSSPSSLQFWCSTSDFHLFDLQKDAVWECHFVDYNELKCSVHELQCFSKDLSWLIHDMSHKGGKVCW
jgi:hypothetical protein